MGMQPQMMGQGMHGQPQTNFSMGRRDNLKEEDSSDDSSSDEDSGK
jgi:hypothetical protein